MTYYRQDPTLKSGDVPWIKGSREIQVPVTQQLYCGVKPISHVVGHETVQLQWVKGYVKPDGTPGIRRMDPPVETAPDTEEDFSDYEEDFSDYEE